MTILNRVTVILIVLVWISGSSVGYRHRSRRSNNEYILHRCTATAELIRKHRNDEVVAGVNSRRTDVEDSSQMQQRAPDNVATPTDVASQSSEVFRKFSSNVHRRMTHMRRRGNGHARRIAGKHLADTPLRTVNIGHTPENRPLAFRKKNLLPELAHDVSGRKIEPSPRVIIIKPIT